MAMTINTNMASLNAQRNLTKTQSALNVSLGRLSSGLRINSAKDDAAGMAISNRFTAQIKGMDQAVRNANDGISMLQTSEGGMQEVTTILQRMRELAVQASNDTNSASDRASLQGEMDSLFSEIDRISGATKFNGVGLLDGSGGSKSFQIGANSGESIAVQLRSTKTKDLNLNGYSGLGELNSGRVTTLDTAAASNMKINGIAMSESTTLTAASTAKYGAALINSHTGETGVVATAYNTYRGSGGVSGKTADGELSINGISIGASGNMTELVDNINRDASGVSAALNSDGSITLSNNTGENIIISGTNVANTGLVANDTGEAYQGYLSLSSIDGSDIEITDATATKSGVGLWGFNVSTGTKLVEGAAAGDYVEQTATNASNFFVEGDLQINGVDVGTSASASAGDKAVAINAVKDETGVSAKATTQVKYVLNMGTVSLARLAGTAATTLKINNAAIDLSTASTLNDVITAINGANVGIVASAEASTGKLVLTSESGQDVLLTIDANLSADTATLLGTGAASATRGTITLTSDTGTDIKISGTTEGLTKAGLSEQGGSDEAIGTGLSLSSLANANNAIDRIDDALSKVADNRAELGAVQNRLDSTISNLQNASENFSAANGRILDADFAKETAAMSKQQIMMQAGVAMLAQAKQLPQQVLQLLQ